MKLIYCKKCSDVLALNSEERACNCGLSYGFYLDDGLNAQIGGHALPIGFDNHSFVTAIKNQPLKGMGKRFEAFVIPQICDTIKEG